MTGADVLAKALKSLGVPFVTTVCGNGLDPFYYACQRADLPLVAFRNEQAAAYAADAHARLTGGLGVCSASSGVAHAMGVAGLVNAHFDGSPVLLISGASEHSRADAGRFQDLDQVALAAPICKYARTVDRADRMAFYVHEAYARALSGRPGPVHLTVPMDVLAQEVGPGPQPPKAVGKGVVEPRAAGDAALIAEAAGWLRQAQRPVLVAGSGAFYAHAGEALHRLATAMHLPVLVPIWDRGVVDQVAPYFMGVVGAACGGPTILPDADLVIIAGAQVDYRLDYAEAPTIGPAARIIRVDIAPEMLRQGVEPDLAIHGAPGAVLSALLDELQRQGAEPQGDWLAEAARRNREFRRRWSGPPPAAPPMTGQHIVEALRPLLDEQTIFLVDGGNIGQWAHMVLADRYPRHWLTCGASAVVGWGLPGAIATRLAHPDRPVVLLSGDGAFGFTVAELETAVRHGADFVVVLADDQAWGIVASEQLRDYGADGIVASRLAPVRYDLVAEGFGVLGLRAEQPDQILPAVRQGLASGRPTVVHVPIKPLGPTD